MNIVRNLIHKELIDLSCDSPTKQNFFESKGKLLNNLKFVEDTYLDAITEREQEYPTGLELKNISIAIPHTTVDHIKKPFIYFSRLTNNQIEFIQMGTDNVIVKPEYILMLGIREPKEQVHLLSEIMELFNQLEFIEKIRNANSKEEIMELLNKK